MTNTASKMLNEHTSLSKSVKKNAVFAKEDADIDQFEIRNQLDEIKEKGFQEGSVKFNRLYALQLKT